MSAPKCPTACDRARQAFLDLEDRALAPDREHEVRQHLAQCPACQAAWEAWDADARLLRDALAPVPLPRDAASRVAAQVRRQQRQPHTRTRRRVLQYGLAAAAALLVALLGPWAWHGPPLVRVGTLAAFAGRPTVQQPDEDAPSEATQDETLYDGALLVTGEGERLTVRLADGSELTLEEQTEAHLSGATAQDNCGHPLPHVCLHRGEVACRMAGTELFRAVGTPLGTAIFGAADFRVRYIPRQRTRVAARTGRVRLSCPAGVAHIEPGQVWEVTAADGIPRQVATLPDSP
jgi:ferric-dicitrate binding protein FerR (iron transport regulator)